MKKKMVIGIIASLVCLILVCITLLVVNTILNKKPKSKYPNLRWTVVKELPEDSLIKSRNGYEQN